MKTLKTFVFCLLVILSFCNVSFSQGKFRPPANVDVVPYYLNPSETIFHPLVTWDSLQYQDSCMIFEVYRARLIPSNDTTYYYIGSTTSLQYLDDQITLYTGPGGLDPCELVFVMFAYKVRVVNLCNNTATTFSPRDTISGYADPCAPEGRPKMNYNGNSDNYSLNQNFPNPFNPTTTISFSIPDNEFVSLKVYDLSGKEVANLINSSLVRGSYKVDFNAEKLSSGIYIYKLVTKNFSDIKRMILVK